MSKMNTILSMAVVLVLIKLMLLSLCVQTLVYSQEVPDIRVRYVELNLFNNNPREGDTLTMRCRIELDNPNSYYPLPTISELINVVFHRDGVPFTRNGIIIGEDFMNRTDITLSVGPFQLLANVVISSITRDDSGLYGCKVYNKNNTEIMTINGEKVRENAQTVSVQYYPSASFPQCSSPVQQVYVGSQVTLRCTSEDGNPQVNLQWRSLNRWIASRGGVQSRQDGIVRSELTLITTPTDINDEYICEIVSPAFFPGNSQNCLISVKVVLPVPLSVQPRKAEVAVGGSVNFTCHPNYEQDAVEAWEWNQEPAIEQSRIVTYEDVLQIVDIQDKDSKTMVFCYAVRRNNLLESASALLLVNHDPESDQEQQFPQESKEEYSPFWSTTVSSFDSPQQESNEQTVVDNNAKDSHTGWISAFVVLLILSVALTVSTVFLFLKLRNKSEAAKNTTNQNSEETSPTTNEIAMSNAYDTNSSQSPYIGLRRSHPTTENEEYTELNISVNSAKTTDGECVFTNKNGFTKEDDAVYEVSEPTPPKAAKKPEKMIYENV